MNSREWQIIVLLAIGGGSAYIVLQHPEAATPLVTGIGVVTVLLALLDRGQQR
ncbi:hypothetical protein ACIHFD_67275 [Nonomuraea sp. NPDC051941]|uniref:hypothetical protein n=1 Tax=unclassified Nonomuraea TaxID=2593643 RepID=UPI003438C6D2